MEMKNSTNLLWEVKHHNPCSYYLIPLAFFLYQPKYPREKYLARFLMHCKKRGHFPCKIPAPCKFLTRFLLLTNNCACTILASLSSFFQERGHIQCTKHANTSKIFSLGWSSIMIKKPQLFMELLSIVQNFLTSSYPPQYSISCWYRYSYTVQ